jgi:outer membrane protein assembly factor BamA
MFIWVVSVETDTTATSQDFRLATVKFVGVRQVSKKQLAENLAAKTPNIWKFWKPKPTLNRTDLEGDLLRIKQYYQRKGC